MEQRAQHWRPSTEHTEALPNEVVRECKREMLRPFARTAYYILRGSLARVRVRSMSSFDGQVKQAPAVFLIGCGRSGTTVLGHVLSGHPNVHYLYEPYDLWAAIDSVTDFLQLYSRGEAHCFLDARSYTLPSRERFVRLMSPPSGKVLVEKSPVNTLRIGYLNVLAPGALFVHIVRDGTDVCRSVERLAATTLRMRGRGALNEWWGVNDAKWGMLMGDGCSASYYPEEVNRLSKDTQRGAYEWLVSLREVDRWRGRLGGRLFEVTYPALTTEPREALARLAEFIDLPVLGAWLGEAVREVAPTRRHAGPPIGLPAQMSDDFNAYQERYGFEGRAERLGGK